MLTPQQEEERRAQILASRPELVPPGNLARLEHECRKENNSETVCNRLKQGGFAACSECLNRANGS